MEEKVKNSSKRKGFRWYLKIGCLLLILLFLVISFFSCGAGPFIGRVVDAGTGKSIKGASIEVCATYGSWFDYTREVCKYGHSHILGLYFISPIFRPGLFEGIDMRFYKAGYVAQISSPDSYFGIFTRYKKSHYIANKVGLEKWDDTKYTMFDHVKQIGKIRCDYFMPGHPKKQRFCREAREEMILACLEWDKERTTEQCNRIVDRKLGMSE